MELSSDEPIVVNGYLRQKWFRQRKGCNLNLLLTGKMQYGAAWWFLDSKAGIEKHLATVSNFGLLGRFIGMLTDSRSFLSFPRHEYFRRILANYLGNLAESGEVAMDIKLLSQTFSNISYHNANNYFNF